MPSLIKGDIKLSAFRFKSEIKQLPIEKEENDGSITTLKVYEINVGEREQTKKWFTKVEELKNMVNDMGNNPNSLDEMEKAEKEICDGVLGEGEFDYLMGIFENNLFIMLGFVKQLGDFFKDEIQGIYKKYV